MLQLQHQQQRQNLETKNSITSEVLINSFHTGQSLRPNSQNILKGDLLQLGIQQINMLTTT